MQNKLDLDILPMFRRGGFDQAIIPGLHLAVPPRRTARGRRSDLLVAFLDLQGNAPITPNQQTLLLSEVSKTYYQHRGSVTASMHAAAEGLNRYLLERNLRSAGSGLQSTALFTLLVAREQHVTLGQTGPIHVFFLSPTESKHIYDTQVAGRGLGTSRSTPIRFSQMEIGAGGLILLSPAPPPTWTAANLKGSHALRLDLLHNQLLEQAGPDLTAVLVKVQPGEGRLHLLQPATGGSAREEARTHPAPPRPAPPGPQVQTTPTPAEGRKPRPASAPPPEPPPGPADQGFAPPVTGPVSARAAVSTAPMQPDPHPVLPSAAAAPPKPQRPPAGERLRRALGPAILAISRALRNTWDGASESLRTLLGRMTPGEGAFTLPSSVMAGVALTVPFIVVTIAAVVYFQRGLASQHQAYLTQAEQVAAQAAEAEGPEELRLVWETTLDLLETAGTYGQSEAAVALRAEARSILDQLNSVVRLSLQPALTSRLSEDTTVGRLVATTDELYLLNRAEGSVLRAWLTGRGYELDPTFRCAPGAYGSFIIGPLIDIAPIPKGNEFNASLVAIDGDGNLIYCIPGQSPISAPLVPPDSNWGQPTAIALDSGNLYVLDPQTNAVWIYPGVNGNFRDRPRLFFSGQVPPMQDVIDLAINRQDLYLLHTDGHLTTCTFSAVPSAPTRCEDPAMLTDPRPGRESGPVLADGLLQQIFFAPPPDPSIYLLDPADRAVFHFSLRLTLQRQLQAETELSEAPATAFTVSPNRTLFIASGNEVFYGSLP
jgi:hypothetical protein